MKALIEIEIDGKHLHSESMQLYDRLKGYKCELKTMTDVIPIDFINTVIEEYTHMIEHYLYDDDEDLKEYLCYRNCLNNLKRRWKKQCER